MTHSGLALGCLGSLWDAGTVCSRGCRCVTGSVPQLKRSIKIGIHWELVSVYMAIIQCGQCSHSGFDLGTVGSAWNVILNQQRLSLCYGYCQHCLQAKR